MKNVKRRWTYKVFNIFMFDEFSSIKHQIYVIDSKQNSAPNEYLY